MIVQQKCGRQQVMENKWSIRVKNAGSIGASIWFYYYYTSYVGRFVRCVPTTILWRFIQIREEWQYG